jgi:hypothetical protein
VSTPESAEMPAPVRMTMEEGWGMDSGAVGRGAISVNDLD